MANLGRDAASTPACIRYEWLLRDYPSLPYAGPRDVCKLTFETEEASKPVTPIGGGKRLGTRAS